MREKFPGQDRLTTLIALDPNRPSVEVIGSTTDYLPVQDGHPPFIAQMAAPRHRILPLPVTQGDPYRAGHAYATAQPALPARDAATTAPPPRA